MNSLRYDLKLFVDEASVVALDTCIPVFHRWIQEQCLDELLIDVADYRHVQHGPGVVLVAHDAHYAMDAAEGRLGLLYSRRRETHPDRRAIHSLEERLRSVLHCALSACQHLASDPAWHGRLRFHGHELLLRCNDRLPDADSAAYHALGQALAPCLETLFPQQQVAVERVPQRDGRLTVVIKAPPPQEVGTLLARLQAETAVLARAE